MAITDAMPGTDSFGLQWTEFRATQLDSATGLPLTFRRFWESTKWKPKDLYGKTVLEAGSGAGRFTEILLDAGAKVTTFDPSEAINSNRKSNTGKGDVSFHCAEIYDMPFEDGAYDFVFCYGVLQHLPDPDLALRNLVSKLKPGGRISIDYYLKHNRLDPFYQPKYFWRRWTTKMEPERLLRIIRGYMPWWLPLHTLMMRVPFIGPKIAAATMIPCWNYLRSGLTKQQRLEWAILDTFDALASPIDEPRTLDEVRVMLRTLPELTDIDVSYGSTGVVANARRKTR